jgi:hypothetical protein
VVALAESTVGRDVNVHYYGDSARRAVEHWRARRVPRAVDGQYEDWVAESFVEPEGWEQARSILVQRRMVLLTAASGTGGRTAAIRLLRDDERRSGPIHELPVHEDRDEQVLDRDDVAENDRLLLDLATVGDDLTEALHRELPAFWSTVRERNAVLVVVLPERKGRDLDAELGRLLVPLGRPNGTLVLERHLAAYGIQPAPDELSRPDLAQVVDHGSMQDIAHVASLVRQARDRSDHVTGFATLLEQALVAHAARADEAAAHVDAQSGRGRSLMLASALFEGALADTVFEADRLLVRLLNLPGEQGHPFEEPDLHSRLAELGAEIGRDGRVRFRKLGYAEAVRRHFWKHFPGLRNRFRDWIVTCGRVLPSVEGGGDDVVRRYLDICLEVNRSQDVFIVVGAWTSSRPLQAALALSALEYGLADARDGWKFRAKCYDWSVNHRLPAPLGQVVIAACVDVIAPNHPQQALVRLHHLTLHRDEELAGTARSALDWLSDDRRVLRRLLARLADPTRSNLSEPRDRSLFLVVAEPNRLLVSNSSGRPLLSEAGVRSAIVHGWAEVLRYGTKAEYEGSLRQWFEVVTGRWGDGVLNVLVEACRADFRASATLESAANRWLENADRPEVDVRRGTVHRLRRAIDAALEMTVPADERLDEGQS